MRLLQAAILSGCLAFPTLASGNSGDCPTGDDLGYGIVLERGDRSFVIPYVIKRRPDGVMVSRRRNPLFKSSWHVESVAGVFPLLSEDAASERILRESYRPEPGELLPFREGMVSRYQGRRSDESGREQVFEYEVSVETGTDIAIGGCSYETMLLRQRIALSPDNGTQPPTQRVLYWSPELNFVIAEDNPVSRFIRARRRGTFERLDWIYRAE
ncbi:MAG: hypothetical protein AAFY59_05035 [Pseudomonadota bacterium]